VKRGEIWSVAGGVYASKKRPAVIVQNDDYEGTDSVTVVPFTTDPVIAPGLRVPVAPDAANGLVEAARLMVDKVTTVRRTGFGRKVGMLAASDQRRLNQALLVFLGIA